MKLFRIQVNNGAYFSSTNELSFTATVPLRSAPFKFSFEKCRCLVLKGKRGCEVLVVIFRHCNANDTGPILAGVPKEIIDCYSKKSPLTRNNDWPVAVLPIHEEDESWAVGTDIYCLLTKYVSENFRRPNKYRFWMPLGFNRGKFRKWLDTIAEGLIETNNPIRPLTSGNGGVLRPNG